MEEEEGIIGNYNKKIKNNKVTSVIR